MPSHFDQAITTAGNIIQTLGNAAGAALNQQLTKLDKRITHMSQITSGADVNFADIKVIEKAGEFAVLPKGGNIKLTTAIFGVGLGWDASSSGQSIDLDASAILLTADKHPATDTPIIYYAVREDATNSIRHSGDNLTGAGNGDDETIIIDTNTIPATVAEIDVIVNVYDAAARRQNFGQVRNAYVRLYDVKTGEVFVRYDLEEDYSTNSGVIVGKLYLNAGEWKFKALGTGVNGTISEIARAI